MITYAYEIGPKRSVSRAENELLKTTGYVRATSHNEALAKVCEIARELSHERKREYGVIRVH